MAQKDAKVNIELAATSAALARETKKDGSAMKTIAILTMFFLPGTFLAVSFAFSSNYPFQFHSHTIPLTFLHLFLKPCAQMWEAITNTSQGTFRNASFQLG